MDSRFTCPEPCLEKHLKGHRKSITALSFNPNERQIASSSLDNTILLWDLHGMRSYRFQGHDEAVMDITFSPSGQYMASASRDKTVRVWVPTVTGSTGVFKAHSQTVRSVQFSSDGKKILTASDDKIIKLWSSDKYKFIMSFVGHTNWVRRASMSQDCTLIASCSDDKSIKLWNIETGSCIHTFKDQKTHGVYLAWHPSSCYIAVGTVNGNVMLYDIRTHNLVQYYSIHNDYVNQVAFHPSGSFILTASKDGTMKILDLLEGHPLFTLSAQSGAVNTVTFSPTGDSFASAGEEKLVYIWKTNFTELGSETKENLNNNISTPQSQNSKVTSKGKTQGSKMWFRCYHSNMYPIKTILHLDNGNEVLDTIDHIQEPNAHSTLLESAHPSRNVSLSASHKTCPSGECSNNIGDISHLPRTPPVPGTYTIPSLINKSVGTNDETENIFGMIKLSASDVCYTNGTIEWVGRKRSYPINSGFKILKDNKIFHDEPVLKKVRKINRTFTIEKFKECDCADVLPTVNAIVDHLNALHEAVDIVDLRLNTLEDVIGRNE